MEITTQRDGLEVTAVSRLKHTELWEAAKAFGSVKALATHLGIHQTMLGDWINLHRVPPKEPSPRNKWSKERLDRLEADLLQITGLLLCDLFPDSLRTSGFLDHSKLAERRHILNDEAIANYALATRQRLIETGNPNKAAEDQESREVLSKVMRSLTSRERQVIELRYGLGSDGKAHTLQETGRILKIMRERVRQIESKALKKLQHETRADQLVELFDHDSDVIRSYRQAAEQRGSDGDASSGDCAAGGRVRAATH